MEIAEEYLALKEIDQIPPRVALSVFTEIAGDRDVSHYTLKSKTEIQTLGTLKVLYLSFIFLIG